VLANAVDERGVFTQHYQTKALDASALIIPLFGFLPPDDDRVRATVLAIADELTVDGLVLRYRTDETEDGLEGAEGTFTICSFWLVQALVLIGELERARTLCEKLLSFAGPLQLYAEQIDPYTGRQLGNFPQAFTHLALINAVTHLIRAEGAEAAGTFRPAHDRTGGTPWRSRPRDIGGIRRRSPSGGGDTVRLLPQIAQLTHIGIEPGEPFRTPIAVLRAGLLGHPQRLVRRTQRIGGDIGEMVPQHPLHLTQPGPRLLTDLEDHIVHQPRDRRFRLGLPAQPARPAVLPQGVQAEQDARPGRIPVHQRHPQQAGGLADLQAETV